MSSDLAERVALGAGRERRLHPLSWLFVLLASLREFALPLVALLVFGSRGDGWERYQWWGLVGVAALTGLAVVRYFTYRFRIDGAELVIRSGILHRNVRQIPLHKIQNVALKRNVLHRMFDVAEVKLESAVGGVSSEAQMRVLSMRDAQALEALVRTQGAQMLDAHEAGIELDEGDTLLKLSPVELVKLGLTSNRGLLIGAAGAGVFSQFGGDAAIDLASAVIRSMFGYARDLHLGLIATVAMGAVLVALLVALVRVVSILLTVLRFHDFTLREVDHRLSVESGLLNRLRSSAPLAKIQHWTLSETWLHRWFARRSLRVETAVLQMANEQQALADLVPIAPVDTLDGLMRRWLPWLDLDALPWQPLHANAWRRIAFGPVLATTIAALAAVSFVGPISLLLLALIPLWVWRARRHAHNARWAVDGRVLAWRDGWWERRTSFAEIAKLQGLALLQSPFDRRRGMATLVADTAGASPFGHRLVLRYLPEGEARALYERLGAQLRRSRLAW